MVSSTQLDTAAILTAAEVDDQPARNQEADGDGDVANTGDALPSSDVGSGVGSGVGSDVGSDHSPDQVNPVLDDLFNSGQAGQVKAAVASTKNARKNSSTSQQGGSASEHTEPAASVAGLAALEKQAIEASQRAAATLANPEASSPGAAIAANKEAQAIGALNDYANTRGNKGIPPSISGMSHHAAHVLHGGADRCAAMA